MTETYAIQMNRVSRYYGARPGIVDVTATIREGRLVGLLGPNGSGKTTTIRLLTGYLPPSEGEVRVCGYDVFEESLEVRKRIGYLPENCPLYPEMRVIDYLRWIGELKGITGSELDTAIFQSLGQCGLDGMTDRVIGHLSKGYRQRVGLASILLFRPPVMILDEPTIGLDPLQAREFRRLIETLRGRHTIILSSHILTEVEMLCDEILIVSEGRLVTQGTPDELKKQVRPLYRLCCKRHSSYASLLPVLTSAVPDIRIEEYTEGEEGIYLRMRTVESDPRELLFQRCAETGIVILEMGKEEITLEDVFVEWICRSREPSETAEMNEVNR
jgi:ABC-2 type transport system ATP-binding protein